MNSGPVKSQTSHLKVFGWLAWVHILKKRRHKLEPKSWEMIFVGYEPGSKGYQFWDAAHQCFKISCDVKLSFPVKEMKLTQSTPAPLSDHQIPESDNESDSLGLDLVNLAQPPTRPPSPGLSASGQTASLLICLGCNKNIWSQRSKYKSYGALRVWSGGKGLSPGVVYGKDSGIVR